LKITDAGAALFALISAQNAAVLVDSFSAQLPM
jgi:hypothetical protein